MTGEGPQDAQPRRFLIATAVAHHQRSPEGNRPGLVEARQKIIDLFTQRLGYTHVSDLGLDPDRNALLQHLDRFATDPDRRPEDIVAVYLAGHGQLIGSTPRRHMFFPADADLAKPKLALPTAQIAAALTDDTQLTQVLLILDTCYAGQGGSDAISAALESLRRSIDDDPSGIAVIASAQPAQQAWEGAFPDLLVAAIESRTIAGERPSTLDLGALITHMNANPSKPPTQRIEWDAARLTGDIPGFFPNPRRRAGPREVDLAIQHAAEWDAQARRRDTEFARRLLVRAMAYFGDREQWWFAGRHEVMAHITDWLEPLTPGHAALVVTAGPGSGKTAVLGLTAALAHSEHRNTVPVHLLGLRPHQVPAVGSVDVAIYAQALTNDDVLRGLSAAVRTPVGVPGDLVEALAERDRPLTVIIDALDEAATPDDLVTQLVRPLLEHGQGRVRLLLGTRRHLLRHLPPDIPVVDLDDPDHRDSRAIASYALRGLLDSRPESPYLNVSPRRSAQVAQAVAEAADPSFLVARIVSGTLAAQSSVADPGDQAWRTQLPRTADAAMARDLDTRLGDDAARARDLLRPLAYAEGQGLPWEDIWAPLASRIAGETYTNDDLLWLKRNAGSYVVEAAEEGRSVYRLYHMALAEHLKRGCDDGAVQQAFLDVLVGGTPRRIDGQRDWSRAHPYALRYLAVHAAYIGRVDELLEDCGYLTLSEPDLLLHALHKVTTSRGRAVRTIYRASAGMHAVLEPAERGMVLAVDAMRHRDPTLSRELAAGHHWKPRWASGTQTSTALRATLIGHTDWVFAVACTIVNGVPVAVTGSRDHTLRIWDLTTNTELRTLIGHQADIDAVACAIVKGTPLAVTGSRDGTARVWDLKTGEQQAALRGHGVRGGHNCSVTAVAFTAVQGEPVVLTGGADGTIRVWDLNSLALRYVLAAHSGFVQGIACTLVDGVPVAVSGGRDEWVKVWDLESGTERDAFWHGGWVTDVACTDVDGKQFAVTDGHVLHLWDLTGSGRHRKTAEGTRCVSVATSGAAGAPVIVAGSGEGPVMLWNPEGPGEPRHLGGHTNIVYSVACTEVAGDPVVVAAGLDQEVRVWDLDATMESSDPGGHRAIVWSMAWATHGGRSVLVTGAVDGSATVWNVRTGEVEASFGASVIRGRMAQCAETAGEPWVITRGRADEVVHVWDPCTGAELGSWDSGDMNTRVIGCMELEGRRLAFVEAGTGRAAVVDLGTGAEPAILSGLPLASTWLDGRQVALFVTGPTTDARFTTDVMGEIWAWDPGTGKERLLARAPMAPVQSLSTATLQGTSLAVSGHVDGEVRLWDLLSGAQLSVVRTEPGEVRRVALGCRQGTLIVAVAHDNTVEVRDARTGSARDTWVFPYAVGTLSFGPAGELAVATGHEVVLLEPQGSLS
ncbi:caspase family protein [Streptomyces tibetensis]|uniref:caspase family protein n=1 Tax=Streptomyces tibetensis TaxID=2382123 RepID=UPI0033FC35A3